MDLDSISNSNLIERRCDQGLYWHYQTHWLLGNRSFWYKFRYKCKKTFITMLLCFLRWESFKWYVSVYLGDRVFTSNVILFARSGMLLLLSIHSVDPCLWRESVHPAFGPTASLSLYLASSSITPAGSVHKSMGDNVMPMWVQLKRWCVSCGWVLQRGHSGDKCDWHRLCVRMIWGREIWVFWVGQGCDELGGEVSLQSW